MGTQSDASCLSSNTFELFSLTERSIQFKVTACGKFSNDSWEMEFKVERDISTPWCFPAKKPLVMPHADWGLWESDVVEAFLQWRLHPDDWSAPYLELNFSPTQRAFSLVIYQPREIFATPLKPFFETVHSFNLAPGNKEIWELKAKGHWPDLMVAQGHLWGSFNACLGPGPFREYHGMVRGPGDRPDFHRPKFFLPFKVASC